MSNTDTDKIERWKVLAEKLLQEDKPAYAKDANDEYYFGKLLLIGEETFSMECFSPENKKGKKFYLRWIMITKFDEYREDM